MIKETNDKIFLDILKIIGSNIIYILLFSFLVAISVFFLFRSLNTSDFYEIKIEFKENDENADIIDWIDDNKTILSDYIDTEITNLVCEKFSPGVNSSIFLNNNNIILENNNEMLYKIDDLDKNCVSIFIKGFLPSLKKSKNLNTISSSSDILKNIERFFLIEDYLNSDIFLNKITNELKIENILSSTTSLDAEKSLNIPGLQKKFIYQLNNLIEINSSNKLDTDYISKVFAEEINDYYIDLLSAKLNNQISSLNEISNLTKTKIKQSVNTSSQSYNIKLQYLKKHLEKAESKNIIKNQISIDSLLHYTNYNFHFYGSEYIKDLIDFTEVEKNNIEKFYDLNYFDTFLQDDNFESWLNDNYFVNLDKINSQSYFIVNTSRKYIASNENLYSLASFIISFFLILIFFLYRKLINV